MLTAKIKYSDYENIVVDCPRCGHELVFNRASDLCTFEPIFGANVSCFDCKGGFWLNGDSVNERHEAIIYSCHDLLEAKRYMNCILNVCQAYEMFFSLYLRVKLLYVPFGANSNRGSKALAKMNQLSRELSRKTKKFTFWKMRNLFLYLAIDSIPSSNLGESETYIDALANSNPPEDAELNSLVDRKLAHFLVRIRRTNIHELRNEVVHKEGYRPTRTEAEDALGEALSVLLPLTWQFDVHDDVNWYCKGSR